MAAIAAKNKKCYIWCGRSSEVFVEHKETLNELLQKLYDSTKKEKGLTLMISFEKNNAINSML